MDDERLFQVPSGDPDFQAGLWHRQQRKRASFQTSCYYTYETALPYGCQYNMRNSDQWAQNIQRRQEKQVLVNLFRLTDGRNWRANDNWEDLGDPCWDSWYGVTCDEHGHVISVELADNHLVGVLPGDLGKLKALLKLDLSTTAPEYHAHPNSNANEIRGGLPSLAGATRIEEIEISGNKITLPSDLWENGNTLRTLSANHNDLTALPLNLRRFVALHTLELGHNAIQNVFPEDFGYLSNARFVQLEYNKLRGAIPENIVDMRRVRALDLSHNPDLTGEIPDDIISMWTEVDYISILNTTIEGYIASLCIDMPFCWKFQFDTHKDLTWATAKDVPDVVDQTIQLAQGGLSER